MLRQFREATDLKRRRDLKKIGNIPEATISTIKLLIYLTLNWGISCLYDLLHRDTVYYHARYHLPLRIHG